MKICNGCIMFCDGLCHKNAPEAPTARSANDAACSDYHDVMRALAGLLAGDIEYALRPEEQSK
jgi:hypothetical protein